MAERPELAVYAVSYDPVDTLARFATTHGITYPLLADVGSAVITELGLLNVTLAEERAAYGRPIEPRHEGIPYPGSFLLDEAGVLTGKRFEQSHRIRPTANTILGDLGLDGADRPASAVEAASPGVRLAAWLDTEVVSANQLQNVHVRFQLDPDVHLYTEPVPPGFQAVEATLSGDDRLRLEPVAPLSGEEFRVEGLDETFHVVDGEVELAIPFFLLSNRDTAGDAIRPVPVVLELSYQACTAEVCHQPERIALELTVQEAPNPGYETADLTALAPLVMRRIVEGPKSLDELAVLVDAALEGVTVDGDQLDEAIGVLEQRGLITRGADRRWAMVGDQP